MSLTALVTGKLIADPQQHSGVTTVTDESQALPAEASKTIKIGVDSISAVLSALVGEPARLVEHRLLSGASAWLVMPAQRGRIDAPFWKAVRADASGGVWYDASEALQRFSEGVSRWMTEAAANSPSSAAELLRQLLAQGEAPVAELKKVARDRGVSASRLDRAARRIGVVRSKGGLRSGWTWALPVEGSSVDIEVDAEQPLHPAASSQSAHPRSRQSRSH